ncbi:zinc ribbon domain-containing protein YjdM [Haploplasma axanthum]|uniref:Putative alkylphosphonate utilization operon protein PhnA n=1 Tax=Haploplasma axanthum TaxID=29552 RepID=A0A449BEM2_HAPAX|nr:zinc ribbon domain-containing protein YjdM [Haploplasma axanthum]VEU80904.1 putative alkylphosphonate utilization operon protein PhnA [Haploplasma axanthum]
MDCPSCGFEYTYEEDNMIVCSACQYKWEKESDVKSVLDANGNKLYDGDSVIIIKDLKVKGSSDSLKQGTKVNSIRIVDGDHNIDCRIPGFGNMSLKSEFVKKA